MSSDLSNSATLAASTQFRALVQAAILEYAIAAIQDRTGNLETMQLRHALARQVIHDPASFVVKFANIVADDASVSATSDPATVNPADVRSVVASVWVAVAAATPSVD